MNTQMNLLTVAQDIIFNEAEAMGLGNIQDGFKGTTKQWNQAVTKALHSAYLYAEEKKVNFAGLKKAIRMFYQ